MSEFLNELKMTGETADDALSARLGWCFVANAVKDDLGELAQMIADAEDQVASGDKVGGVAIVNDAPALEFDLEGELAKAFGEADVEPVAVDASALPSEISHQMDKVHEQAAQPAFTDEPTISLDAIEEATPPGASEDFDFSDMIGDELERALAEEVAADLSIGDSGEFELTADEAAQIADASTEQADQVAVEIAERDTFDLQAQFAAVPQEKEQPVDEFAKELSLLMGDQEALDAALDKAIEQPAAAAPFAENEQYQAASAPAPAQPAAPDTVLAPWDRPEIVDAPHVPVVEPEAELPPAQPVFEPAQTSDYVEAEKDFSDPAADLNALLDDLSTQSAPTPQMVVP